MPDRPERGNLKVRQTGILLYMVPTGTMADDGTPHYRGYESVEAADEYRRTLDPVPEFYIECKVVIEERPR